MLEIESSISTGISNYLRSYFLATKSENYNWEILTFDRHTKSRVLNYN